MFPRPNFFGKLFRLFTDLADPHLLPFTELFFFLLWTCPQDLTWALMGNMKIFYVPAKIIFLHFPKFYRFSLRIILMHKFCHSQNFFFFWSGLVLRNLTWALMGLRNFFYLPTKIFICLKPNVINFLHESYQCPSNGAHSFFFFFLNT
jgi:hypothetical protein